ncbi:MAG: YggT family protein [Candidatus Omnitrophica bacterium]|nr:YggT family protein [Candidatus Omnitrophota bacterium]
MAILGNFILAVAQILDIILFWLYWMILIRALISWVNPDPYNVIVQFLNRTTEPILQPIRRLLPPMGIDLSPIIAFFAILFLQTFLIASLKDIGYSMRTQSKRSQPAVIFQQTNQGSSLDESIY